MFTKGYIGYIDSYHSRNATVIAFLPKPREDALKAIDAGVDMIITDHEIYTRNEEQ